MFNPTNALRVTVLVVLCIATGSVFAQHPFPVWADARLSVRDGVVLWLDAQAIQQARKQAGSDQIKEGERLERWPDASGHHRDCIQATVKRQPRLVQVGNSWVVRFDGQDDFLRCDNVAGKTPAVTVFIVAAAHDNAGDFRGFFASSAPGKRDYQSGFNIDLGPGFTRAIEVLNVEGIGFGGAQDLYQASTPFGTLHTMEVIVDPEARIVRVAVDGQESGSRAFAPQTLTLDELTVGSRALNDDPQAEHVRGALRGDIAEALLFDRVLSPEETSAVREYLQGKHKQLAELLPTMSPLESGKPLVKVANPPPIHLLVPGFRVRELPIELPNVNNVRFRDDGRLLTLGYNGDVNLLSDTDGDGLEDHADIFWKNDNNFRGPLGMLPTPPGYTLGRGVFVPSKGKVSLIVDVDGDDSADKEVIVADGWKEISQNVDAVGIAMDRDGSIVFGLGTANYANAYQTDEAGNAAYDLASDRGTIQRVAPDFSRRETVCTGIRFPIAFAFNRAGDLFCTEQEGATWLPNGNPLDELLHVQPGRHFGFPPRHPRHNPNVIDEPSTFDYGPQHQSTCGMVFNEPVNGGSVFGPNWWTGDAIVCGESRGKLWRTKLVHSDSGYVAATQLIAALQMLTVDACVAPNGDLVVACHSGPPDWGTGPTGTGKLFRIQMVDAEAPRPVATWAASKNEIRIAFDRSLDPTKLRELSSNVNVEFGEFVRAVDRYENLVPPYAVVQRQLAAARHSLAVAGVSITNDLRTLIVSTAAMQLNSHYAVTIPTTSTSTQDEQANVDASIDVDFALQGVGAEWKSLDDSGPSWTGWLPHLDLNVASQLTAGSSEHDEFWSLMQQPGELTLSTQLDLHHILRPKVQPGATIDYEWPAEHVTLTLKSNVPLSIQAPSDNSRNLSITQVDDTQLIQLTTSGDATEYVGLTVKLSLSKPNQSLPRLTVSVNTNEDERPRPLPLNRFYLPWVQNTPPDEMQALDSAKLAELEGGNWGRGRRVFHSQAAGCFKCHSLGVSNALDATSDSSGGNRLNIGPDLSNLVHRDYQSVLRDIVNPSYSINPDHLGQIVLLKDGRVLTGVVQTREGRLLLGDEKGNVTQLDRSEIETVKNATTSIMPKELDKALTPEQLRDLMTFLLTPPPHMPLDSPLTAPPLRTAAEVMAALAGAPTVIDTSRPLNMVLIAGKKDHGPGEHDYPAWQLQWGQLLAAAENVTVALAWDFPSDEQLTTADSLVFFQKGTWNDDRAKKLDQFLARGGGASYIHWAVNGDDRVADFSQRIGMASRGGSIGFRHGPLSLDLHSTDHPILRNMEPLQLYDESYWRLTGDPQNVTLLASSREDGAAQPQMWVYEKAAGRIFVSIPGHYSWTFDDPLFRILLLRGIAWSMKEPIDRFNELVPLGARMTR